MFDDELMGELVRFVSSHEVGHTLGLRHNFGSSNTVPVEKLRDKIWVEANGSYTVYHGLCTLQLCGTAGRQRFTFGNIPPYRYV